MLKQLRSATITIATAVVDEAARRTSLIAVLTTPAATVQRAQVAGLVAGLVLRVLR